MKSARCESSTFNYSWECIPDACNDACFAKLAKLCSQRILKRGLSRAERVWGPVELKEIKVCSPDII